MKQSPKKKGKVANDAALLGCMDYLHGDVAGGELEAACTYEYARESEVLREAARLRASGISDEIVYMEVEQKFRCGSWFIQIPWGALWSCPSFPKKTWNQLSDRERAEIVKMGLFPLPSGAIAPLRMNEVWRLDAMRVFDMFKKMAAEQMDAKAALNPKPSPRVFPIIEGWPTEEVECSPWVHALFTLDFTKTKKRLRQEFEKWLDLPENKRRFAAHRQNPIGKLGVFKDRLKDLAAWRLYRQLGCEKALTFSESNRLHNKGRARAFYDPRQGQARKVPLNEASLYSEESGFQKAKARALAYRAELLTWEFGEIAREREQAGDTFIKAVFEGLKVSKSSS